MGRGKENDRCTILLVNVIMSIASAGLAFYGIWVLTTVSPRQERIQAFNKAVVVRSFRLACCLSACSECAFCGPGQLWNSTERSTFYNSNFSLVLRASDGSLLHTERLVSDKLTPSDAL